MPQSDRQGHIIIWLLFCFLPVIEAVNEMKNKSAYDNGSNIG